MVCYRRVDCPIMNYFRCLVTLGLALAGGILMAAPGNSIVLNLEPNAATPRNSEGAFVTLKSGRILLLYTQFYGGGADESPARIVSVYSDDAGRTWSRAPQVVVENTGHRNVMSVSLLRLQSGKIALFYLIKNSWHDCRPWMRLSTDEARTWSAPVRVVDAPGYFVLNNDRVIQLRQGRLIAPVAFHRARRSNPADSHSWDSRALDLWYLSDDEGRTWREADDWWAAPLPSRTGLQEPGVVELADGRVLTWARTDLGAQWGCVSTNAGRSWPPPAPTSMRSSTPWSGGGERSSSRRPQQIERGQCRADRDADPLVEGTLKADSHVSWLREEPVEWLEGPRILAHRSAHIHAAASSGSKSFTGRASSRHASCRTRSRRSSSRYSTGDLPSTRARNSPGRRLAARWKGCSMASA